MSAMSPFRWRNLEGNLKLLYKHFTHCTSRTTEMKTHSKKGGRKNVETDDDIKQMQRMPQGCNSKPAHQRWCRGLKHPTGHAGLLHTQIGGGHLFERKLESQKAETGKGWKLGSKLRGWVGNTRKMLAWTFWSLKPGWELLNYMKIFCTLLFCGRRESHHYFRSREAKELVAQLTFSETDLQQQEFWNKSVCTKDW